MASMTRQLRKNLRAARPAQYEGQVDLTQRRAWFDVSTSASLNSFFNTIFEDAMFVAREVGLMQRLVTLYSGTGLAQRKMPVYPQLAAVIVAEGADFAPATEWTKVAQMTLTPQIAKVQNIITQSQIDTDEENTRTAVAREQGGAIGTKIDTDLVDLFTGFTAAVGAAGSALSIARCAAAISQLRNAKAMNPIYTVLHPYGWHDVWVELGQPDANQAFLGDVANLAMRDFYVGQFLAAQWFTDANISIDASDDAIGASFSREALALDMRQEARQAVDTDSSIAGIGYEINLESWYAVGERRDEFGVKITHDAVTPTG